MPPQSRTTLAAALFFGLAFSDHVQAQTQQQPGPGDLVKSVIQKELSSSASSDVQWKYVLEKDIDGKRETREVVETKSGSLDRLLAIAGKPLGTTQQHDELQRLLRLSHNPDEQRKLAEARKKDADQCVAFLKMIPQTFIFEYAGEHAGPNGELVKLTFKPNPNFQPPTREGKVMHELAGTLWVDIKQQRLAAINGQLLNEVKFGGGLLGHLEKGGSFNVKRMEIAPGQWELTEMEVDMRGKALLFKTISVQQNERHHDFQRIPDDITMADAAAMLMNKSLLAEKR
jgi:hypothetical protein